MSVVDMFGERILRQSDITTSAVARVLARSGLNVAEKETQAIIGEPGLVVYVSVAGQPSHKIFYSTLLDFNLGISRRRRMQLANRINSRNVGAAYVDGNLLCVWSTLSFEGGIFAHTIISTLREFRELLEDTLLLEVKGELDWG